MNLTIDELERRLWIENRQRERATLLEFEEAFESAEYWLTGDDVMTTEAVRSAPYTSLRSAL